MGASEIAETRKTFDGATVEGILQQVADEEDPTPLLDFFVNCAVEAEEEAAKAPPCAPKRAGPPRPHLVDRFENLRDPPGVGAGRTEVR